MVGDWIRYFGIPTFLLPLTNKRRSTYKILLSFNKSYLQNINKKSVIILGKNQMIIHPLILVKRNPVYRRSLWLYMLSIVCKVSYV